MLKERAIKEAQKEAQKHHTTMIVVNAPIENAEEDGNYGYATPIGVNILFEYGVPEYHVTPGGAVIPL